MQQAGGGDIVTPRPQLVPFVLKASEAIHNASSRDELFECALPKAKVFSRGVLFWEVNLRPLFARRAMFEVTRI
jgi:hypothetical protein